MNKNLLLHSCCAPCSVACVDSLRNENIEPHIFWYNPNIHLFTEYKSRRDCLINYAKGENIKFAIDDEYGLGSFIKTISPEKKERCGQCYTMRLEKAASFAVQEGYRYYTTTLLISPYQDHEAIKRTCEEMGLKYGVEFLYRDFRPLFREGQAKARAKGFFMQKYCGCVFSEEERFLKFRNKELETGNLIKDNHKIPDTLQSISNSPFERLSLLTGVEALEKLKKTSVLIFGAGGVGSWAAEALVRSGIGKIGIIDNDVICASNINRQVEATSLTLGHPKASALKKRLLEINPECDITARDELFCLENANEFKIEKADFVIDAIDTINHKLDLIEKTRNVNVTLFSSMGMALKIDPSKIKTASIWKTDVCPLARLVRQGLRKRGFTGDFTVVYSSEPAMGNLKNSCAEAPSHTGQKKANGSIVTVTATAGLMLASLVINNVLNEELSVRNLE
ncbi:MAG: epoxyqueuosine reductase QueH [Treponema sp.]|nr:epoxyqueuosine reductase QueH [Treponema sp.]